MFRRLAIWLTALLLPSLAQAEPIHIIDILGREVVIPAPARRIVLGQGRYLPVLGLLEADPVARIVGWKDDFKRDPATFELWRRKFPAIDMITTVGGPLGADFSVEFTIALKPDLVVLSLFIGEVNDSQQMKRILAPLEAAGIPAIFVDFFARPMRYSSRSVRVLGKALGLEARAETFARMYEDKLALISQRLEQAHATQPSVFMHAHAGGTPCCYTSGRGVFDDIIKAAGGRNIARERLPGATGQMSLEFLLGEAPDFYIPTGGAHLAPSGLVLGTGVNEQTARKTFERLVTSPGINELSAVTEGRTFGVWHMFNDSPINIVLIELLAKRLHPKLFPDFDPARTLAEISNLSAVPLEGVYWYPQNSD